MLEQSVANRVFYYFEQLCSIPHGSGNTKAISDYCVQFAKDHALVWYQDAWNNVILIREAHPDYKEKEAYIIQGHLDMVCEKEANVSIDFETEGLTILEENGCIRANGTTLGADDGIAIAIALALLEKEELKAPRLEAVFTVDEETGMFGAAGIDLSMLKGHQMLNLDSEEEGSFLCGCAGGMRSYCSYPVSTQEKKGVVVSIRIDGLLGGHSGVEIQKGRLNAICAAGRVLHTIAEQLPYELISIEGGQKDNAIPRAASIKVHVSGTDISPLFLCVKQLEVELAREYHNTDAGVHIDLSVAEERSLQTVVTKEVRTFIERFLFLMPNGVQTMSMQIPGLVESSLNAGILSLTKEQVCVSFSVRSNVKTKKALIGEKLALLSKSLGGSYTEDGDYPAWEYQEVSPLREQMLTVYEAIFHTRPTVDVIHAGVECGLFAEKIPNLDCVSFGPQIDDIHTPKEKLHIASTERIWEFMLAFLAK